MSEKAKKHLYQQFLCSMGLDILPEKGDLCITECGEIKGDGFRVKKLYYQILPDCWASADRVKEPEQG